MRISTNCISLIKSFEGCRLKAYKCPSGIYTIGYGHTKNVVKGQEISLQRAKELLTDDLSTFENGVNKAVSAPLTQNQFDALVSFAFNVGLGAFKSSTLLKKLNAKDYDGASKEFLRWNKSNGVVLNGLKRRRQAEKDLFDQIPSRPITPLKRAIRFLK